MNSNNESEVINFFLVFFLLFFSWRESRVTNRNALTKTTYDPGPKKKNKQRQHLKLQPLFFCYHQASVNWKAHRICITLPSIALSRSGQLGSWKIIITKSRNTRIYVFIGCSRYHKYIK